MKAGIRETLRAWRWPLAVASVTLIGLVIRVCMAWAMRYPACNGDFSIIALMAKHMAEGVDYPIFAYGVAYMGSLEPALAAMVARLFHIELTPFLLNLSPALVGTLLLPLVYLFGREAGTPRAGLFAMLFCLIGSDTLLHNSISPRGGYMNVMVCGVLALWLACRIAARESRGQPVSVWAYFGMGLVAGVAWWVTQLVVVFFLAAGVVLLVGFRWRMVRRGLIPAVVGALLGSLPWWVWNITHLWGSLDFGGSLAKVPFKEGIAGFGRMFLKLIEMEPSGSWSGWFRLVLLLGMAAIFVGILIRDRVRESQDDRFFFRLAAVMVVVFMAAVYSTSSFARVNTTRYLLPVFPAVAVIVAVSCDRLLQRFRFPWALAAFVLVIPPHALLLFRMFDGVPADKARWDMAELLKREAAPLCDGNFVGEIYTTHWLNFASKEQLCVTSLPSERYAPYARRVELAERRAYLNGYGNIGDFLAATASTGQRKTVGSTSVDYALTPPSPRWRYVEPRDITSIRDSRGTDCREALLDAVMDSGWSTLLKPKADEHLTAGFSRPVRLCGIRLHSLNNFYPWRVSVQGRRDATSPWQVLMAPVGVTSYFWSGSYVMVDGMQYFQEFRFDPTAGGISEVRLVLHGPNQNEEPVKLGEALFMEADTQEAAEAVAKALPGQCVAALRSEGLPRYYAPRWLAEHMAVAMTNDTMTRLPSLFSRAIDEMAGADSRDPYPLAFPENTGLFMDSRDVPRTRDVLRAAELTCREIPLGAVTLLSVSADCQTHAGSPFARVVWTEHGCFRLNFLKEKAQLLYESASRPTGTMTRTARLDALREAVRNYPSHYPARQALVSALEEMGAGAEVATNAAVLKATTQPGVPGDAAFRNGAELLGVTVEAEGGGTGPVKRGRAFGMTYYWKSRKDMNPAQWAVFVHFKNAGFKFQDDHVLLSETPEETLRYQPFPEILVERRRVMVPQTAAAGNYELWIGVIDRKSGKRVSVASALPSNKDAVRLPVTVVVE